MYERYQGYASMSCGVTQIDWKYIIDNVLVSKTPSTRRIHGILNDYNVGDIVNIMSGTITKHSAQIIVSENIVGIILNKINLTIDDNVYEVYEVLTGDEKSIVFEEFLQHTVT